MGEDQGRRVGGEFELIARYFAPLAKTAPGALGLTDDAALLDPTPGTQLVATTDALVAGVHFLADDPPETIARKLMRVNLSDLAAMGAVPRGVLLAAAFPRDTDAEWLEGFAQGLARDIEEFATPLIGGDTVATDGPLTLALTALGEVPSGRALLRSGAQAGDGVFVSGAIGDGALGLMACRGELPAIDARLRAALVERYRLPVPRLALGARLAGLAHAAIDVSDGLIADLGHVCDGSGMGAEIDAALVPHSEAGRAALAAAPGLLAAMLTGGDDYELLFTAAGDAAGALGGLGAELGLAITRIGTMTRSAGVSVVGAEGLDVAAGGYSHFS